MFNPTKFFNNAESAVNRTKLDAAGRSFAVVEFDLGGRIVDANQNFLSITGYALHEIVGKDQTMFGMLEETSNNTYERFRENLKTTHAFSDKVKCVAKGGREIWFQASFSMLFDANEQPSGFIKFATDITESELKNREAYAHQSVVDCTTSAIISVNRDLVVTYANEASNKLFEKYSAEFRSALSGFNPSNVKGECISPLLSNPELLNDPQNLPHSADITFGSLKLDLFINATFSTAGEYIGNVIELKDATQTSTHAGIIEALNNSQAVIQFNLEGEVLSANSLFLKVMGYQENEVIGKHHSIFVDPSFAVSAKYSRFWEKMRNGQSASGKFSRFGKNGDEIVLQASYYPILDKQGQPFKVVKFATDVTRDEEKQRKRYEEEQQKVFEQISSGFHKMADGDLTVQIEEEFTGNYEDLRKNFNETVLKLKDVVSTVVVNSSNIKSGAGEISQATDDLSKRTEQQAATLEETAASLEEITSTVDATAVGAKQANDVVIEARENAEQSGVVVQEAVAAMTEIEKSSTQISQIIGVIDEIAFQTNLLALNAGVEAARAGDAGRGFAVVASEVRALAQRSSDAAKEIKGLISASAQHVTTGVDLVGQAGQALEQIVEKVINISTLMSDITVSSQEQAIGLKEVNVAVNQMDQVTQQNAAMVEETTAASHTMTQEALELARLISMFKTGVSTGGFSRPQEATSNSQPIQSPVIEQQEKLERIMSPVTDGSSALQVDEGEWEDF